MRRHWNGCQHAACIFFERSVIAELPGVQPGEIGGVHRLGEVSEVMQGETQIIPSLGEIAVQEGIVAQVGDKLGVILAAGESLPAGGGTPAPASGRASAERRKVSIEPGVTRMSGFRTRTSSEAFAARMPAFTPRA